MSPNKDKLAVIGYGAMAKSLATSLAGRDPALRIGAALVPAQYPQPQEMGLSVFNDVEGLIGWAPSLVVECAGHEAVEQSVPQLLRAGIPVIIVSIGALADDSLLTALEAAASTGGSLSVVSGAIGGLDVLRSARLAGLDEVIYRGIKPPTAWLGTPGEDVVDLTLLNGPTIIFEGSARDAARLYPKNANVTAAVALAGTGFDRTRVTLIADPAATGNTHQVTARGAFGRFEIKLENNPLPDNPKTSWLAALSVEQAVIRHFQTIEL